MAEVVMDIAKNSFKRLLVNFESLLANLLCIALYE